MKKFLILVLLALGVIPGMKDGKIQLIGNLTVSAQDTGSEDGEEYDPPTTTTSTTNVYYTTYQLWEYLSSHGDHHYVIHGEMVFEYDDDGINVEIWYPGMYDFEETTNTINDDDFDDIPNEQDPDWEDYVDWTENILGDTYDPFDEFPEDDPWWDVPSGSGPNNNPNSCVPQEVLGSSVWVATSINDPGMLGYNISEDMLSQDICYGPDLPATMSALNLSVFEVDTWSSLYILKVRMHSLFYATTTADPYMWDIGQRMINRFYYGPPTTFEDVYLNAKVASHPNFLTYKQGIENRVKNEIAIGSGSVIHITTPPVTPPMFPDKLNGLGITIDNVWSARADLTSLKVCPNERRYAGVIKYTLTDNFGLDKNDVIVNNNTVWDVLSLSMTSDGFHAWYILQHIRCADNPLHKPFLTRVVINVPFQGGW